MSRALSGVAVLLATVALVASLVISGPAGPTGPQGPGGTHGVDCWDLNGNGIGDPAEDVNGDLAVNVLDCRGSSQPPQPPQTREFWMFTVALPFNDTPTTPHDYFAPDRIIVYKGDTVLIHFFNTEDVPESHTFTMAAPYAMNFVVPYQQSVNITFVASTAGIFPFRCMYHQPSQTGSLVVLTS